MNARVYYEKAIRLCIAQGRICLFVIRDSKIVQILLKSVLRRKAGISQAVSLVLPFLQATVVEYLDVVLDDKRHDVVTQAFFEMEQAPNSAVAVLERVNSLKAVVKVKQIEYVSCEPSDSLKELFSEGYNADDDSFEEEEMEQA